MKKILAYGGLILLFLLLQCSFFVHLSLADVVPNLLIILTASIAIINGSRSVLWILYVCFRFYDQRQIECIVLFAEDHPAGSCLYSDYRCFPLSNYITDNRALREKRK